MNALVTGGLQGIGKSIVSVLQQRGDRVFVFDIVAPDDDRVKELEQSGAVYIPVDISCVESIENGFSTVLKMLSNNPLDILVNNAGITRDNLAIRMKECEWDDVLGCSGKFSGIKSCINGGGPIITLNGNCI